MRTILRGGLDVVDVLACLSVDGMNAIESKSSRSRSPHKVKQTLIDTLIPFEVPDNAPESITGYSSRAASRCLSVCGHNSCYFLNPTKSLAFGRKGCSSI